MERRMKKGFIFSLFVITALALIVMTYRMKVEFREEKKAEIYKNRVEQINIFVQDMEKDLDRALYVIFFRAVLGADEYIHRHGQYIDNINARLAELMIYGTINGESMDITNASTITDWNLRMAKLSKRLNVNVTFDKTTIEIKHSSPWVIDISMNTTIKVTDFDEVLGWEFELVKSTKLDISEASFPDPIYFIESLDNMGNYSTPLLNRIVKSPYIELWVNESLLPFPNEVNVSNLIDHTLNQFYLNNTRAPSYLMRLAGNFGNSTYGIESFVNVLNDSSIWDYSEEGDATCAADYQFFVTGCTGDSHRIYNMNSRFYLDQEHLNDYDMLSINST